MARILITGAAGFIGSQLLHAFVAAGEPDVVGIDNYSHGYQDNLIFDDMDLSNSVVEMDIRDEEVLEKLFAADGQGSFDYVYHCAAITTLPDCQSNPAEAIDVNVSGTAVLLNLCKNHCVKKFIFASTSAVYENETVFPCVEKFDVNPTLMYSLSKTMGEKLCKSFFDCYGIPMTIMRFANVYGPRMDCLRNQPPVVAYIIKELYCGRAPILHSDGEQRRDFVFSEDLVDLALKVRGGSGFDIVNVSSNESHSINQVYCIIAKLMGKTAAQPVFADDMHFWENYPNLFNPVPIRQEIIRNEIEKRTLCSNVYAYNKYHWSPSTDLEEGIRQCVDYCIARFQESGVISERAVISS